MKYEDLKLAIYEAENSGEINSQTKEKLLGCLNESTNNSTYSRFVKTIMESKADRGAKFKATMNNKYKKESVDDIKLSIYEAYDNGEISGNEKYILLESLKDIFKSKKDSPTQNNNQNNLNMHQKRMDILNQINKIMNEYSDKINNTSDKNTIERLQKECKEKTDKLEKEYLDALNK